MSEINEKNPSSIAQFIPMASKPTRTQMETSRSSMSTSPGSPGSSCLSQDEFASTDDGGDISPTFVDFDDDFVSATSDCEMSTTEHNSMSPHLQQAVTTCVYSVSMLLHLRAAFFTEDGSAPPLRYGTRCKSELPAPAAVSTSKSTIRAQATPANALLSWRQALPESNAESWVAQQRNRVVTDDDEQILRAARSILNKLTLEKFESLFEQLATCGLKHPHHISMLMREIFEKATTQHHFIPMYAELCLQLEKDPRIASVVDETDQMYNFRRLLLNQCQHVFEQVLEARGSEAEKDEEITFCRKQRALGNMKLIGQLLVKGMLSSDLFVECCEALLRNHSRCPEALEALVALMMVAGPKFDNRAWQYYAKLGRILSDMSALIKDKSVAARLRFLMRDVLDARDAGWPWSRNGVKESPAKLDKVRHNAEVLPETRKNKGVLLNAAAVAFVPVKMRAAMTGPQSPASASPQGSFDVVAFRRTIAGIFSDLAMDKNIPAAVQRVRAQRVPIEHQAEQFMDILSRIVEERRGAVRRCELAFIAGLGAAELSAFDRKECLAGIGLFFHDVYDGLCHEVHRLPAIMKSEFMPTVLTVFPASELNKVVPTTMRQ